MAYLTKSNSLKIISRIDLKNKDSLSGEIYGKSIYFFSNYEKNNLLGLKELLKDPENFIKEYYVPVEATDNLKYVYEGGKPSYHSKPDCELLNSSYKNFEIPEQLREKGKDEVIKFRNWFKGNQYLLDDPDAFVARLKIAFGIIINPKTIDFENSGVEVKENLNLNELENRINLLISNVDQYYNNANEEQKEIIRRYQRLTFLANPKYEIKDNNTRFKDEVIKEFLKQYDVHFKKPITNLLIEYYRVKHNPNLKFEGHLLEQLGFRPCRSCHQENIGIGVNKPVIEINTDDLPF